MMRLGRLLLSFLCVLALTAGAPAGIALAGTAPLQTQPRTTVASLDVPSQLEAMRKLDFMVGRWVGSGWTITETGAREEFYQTEQVQYQAGGLVISIQGDSRDKEDPRETVHTAFAVINYNDITQQYRWESFARGYVTEVVPVVGPNTFQWTLDVPGVKLRYTLEFTAKTWHEIGEISFDGGQTWQQNFQMDLRRLK
ncbi:hypothetical protein [Nonomuraea sp. LPB2021202275-12-8]|uniref:hypothetical protein n=1 Tax=Nonomuraea sp. LPB2021202275-12-8 TaxID=3120159 RepID=UPI00300CDB69